MRLLTVLFALMLCGAGLLRAAQPLPVVPAPAEALPGEGHFTFTRHTLFAVEDAGQAAVAESFARLFRIPAGFEPRVKVRPARGGDVRFERDAELAPEAYVLDVRPERITVRAADDSGFFYAMQSLRQLLPAPIEGHERADVAWRVAAVRIEDAPRFAYRGMHLDVARYFMPKEDLLRLIGCMAQLKLNKLHLHLTDDNGWRLEIKRYPRLTEVGAWRVDRPGVPFPARRNPEPGEPTPVGGYYTQDDIREIVAFAAAHRVEVIPEIDVPAHSNAALAAYPELACPVVDRPIGVLPGLGGSNADIIFCAGNDRVFEFLEGVLDEVLALFPSRYIHLGGDEAWKTHWEQCPLCQKRIREEGLASTEELQGYFMQRVCSYVRSRGREVIGWDELTNSTLPEGVIVLGWQGYGEAALKAAARGHRFIMTPARVLYLIRYQGPQWFEPLTYFGNNTLRDVYDYEPVRADWPDGYERLLMGVQASMWTEFCSSAAEVEYLLFPRLVALAEVAWQPRGRKAWPDFLRRLDLLLPRLEAQGVTYARSMYNIQHRVTPDEGALRVELECIRPDVEIRYTTDGSEPEATSPLYEGPLRVTDSATLRCATFRSGRRMGALLELPLRFNRATARPLLGRGADLQLLVNGVRGSEKYTDSEWCTWPSYDDVTVTVDLERCEPLRQLTVGCIANYGMGVHLPAHVAVALSDDNETYAEVAVRDFTPEELFREETSREDLTFDLSGRKARYVQLRFRGAGPCPEGHVRAGQPARVYMDELIIE